MKLNRPTFFLVFALSFLQWNCSSEATPDQIAAEEMQVKPTDSIKNSGLKKGHRKAYVNKLNTISIPDPTLLTRVLKRNDFKYDNTYITPVNLEKVYASTFDRAVSSGVYVVGLGYTALYGDQDGCTNYFKYLAGLYEEIGIRFPKPDILQSRFSSNLDNPDSLNIIVLGTYENVHSYLLNNELEEIGYYILFGTYLESFSVFCNTFSLEMSRNSRQLYNNLFCQQKILLDNMIELSAHYESSENILKIRATLSDLDENLQKYNIKKVGNNFEVDDVPTKEELEAISNKIEEYISREVN